MKTKVIILVLAMVMFLGGLQTVSAQNTGALAVIIDHYAARNFLEGPIPAADLNRIIQAGVRAPSARNLQPWHFTVVQNQTLAKKLVSNIVDGNILIVVSGPGDGKTNYVQILDCALAVQSIYLAAQALGYGSRIYTNPIETLNNSMKAELSLPAGYSAVAVIRVGKVQSGIDAVSSASSRKRMEEVVTYKR